MMVQIIHAISLSICPLVLELVPVNVSDLIVPEAVGFIDLCYTVMQEVRAPAGIPLVLELSAFPQMPSTFVGELIWLHFLSWRY